MWGDKNSPISSSGGLKIEEKAVNKAKKPPDFKWGTADFGLKFGGLPQPNKRRAGLSSTKS